MILRVRRKILKLLCSPTAAAMENLQAELARAKEQVRKSDAAAGKAIEELIAE